MSGLTRHGGVVAEYEHSFSWERWCRDYSGTDDEQFTPVLIRTTTYTVSARIDSSSQTTVKSPTT